MTFKNINKKHDVLSGRARLVLSGRARLVLSGRARSSSARQTPALPLGYQAIKLSLILTKSPVNNNQIALNAINNYLITTK
ncbi:hypothetical protein A3J78_01965 [Candidatus Beckwithbacteria bacterium RBG_13_35_6]|uniref:Uncharacterized protein n=1 Tax=Candidatus Beckwithbacteria bacterium RBG_13_35_6 TaxID=1797456 RepID=A0A1F5DG45_9BACT|nr:MAG: hypothetical protein A3J78_01965 [Candidatus Beckwithbacteria bacterium RBG_13_35_6]